MRGLGSGQALRRELFVVEKGTLEVRSKSTVNHNLLMLLMNYSRVTVLEVKLVWEAKTQYMH